MQPIFRFVSAIALAVLSASSMASTVTFNSSASFMANVAPGAYTEDFTGFVAPLGAASFAGGGFTYEISAPDGLFEGFVGDQVETNQIDQPLTIAFTSGNVRAIGANFFVVDLNDDFQSESVTLTLNDGTTVTFLPTSAADTFRGFVSTVAITSLVFSAPGQSLYAALDNLTVGTVPEPSSLALVGLAVAGLLVVRRRAI